MTTPTPEALDELLADIDAWDRCYPGNRNPEYLINECRDAIAALRRENESLRAECGLRQIQGYNEGKAAAEADNAALRQDAERYRWVNSQHGFVTHADPDINNDYVDAAMREGKKE